MDNQPYQPLPVGKPVLAPKGRGGIYPPGGYDPFFDNDMPERIMALDVELSEHPASRPYLEKYQLSWATRTNRELALLCTKCNNRPCTCGEGDLRARCNEYMVSSFNDPALRLLFDKQKLAVRN